MKIGEAIKTAMKSKKITQTTLADMVGAKSQSVIAERLKMDNISINVVLDMLDAVGYEMTIGPKPTDDNDDDSNAEPIVITK